MCHIFALKRITADKRDWVGSDLPHIAHTGVDTKVSKALAHRASTGQVQLARM